MSLRNHNARYATAAYALILMMLGAANSTSADEVVPFNLKKPPLPEPGKKYRLVLEPGKKAKPVVLLFVADPDVDSSNEPSDESGGKRWTGISAIVQSGQEELPVETDPGVVHLKLGDYDGDGYLDFGIPTTWGTGGTWYEYFRFDGKRYVPWKEPGELQINSFDPKTKTAKAFSRSGPSYLSTTYKIENGRFIKTKREIFDQARSIRDLVPGDIGDEAYVLVVEEIKDGKVVKRKVSKREPRGGMNGSEGGQAQ